MDKKIIAALKKRIIARLDADLPGFSHCPAEIMDVKILANRGVEAYGEKIGERYCYFATVPYVKSLNEYSVFLHWTRNPGVIDYCPPARSFKLELYWRDHRRIPDEYENCEVELTSIMWHNNQPIRDSMWLVNIDKEDFVDKKKLEAAVELSLDEMFRVLREHAIPFFQT
jgi:hypothetical protein